MAVADGGTHLPGGRWGELMAGRPIRNIVMTYFILGVVMWGSGLVGFENTGIVGFFFEDGTAGGPGVQAFEDLQHTLGSVGAIFGLADLFSSTIVAMVTFVTELITFMFWPFLVLQSNGVPTQVSLLIGGPPTVAFFFGLFHVLATR